MSDRNGALPEYAKNDMKAALLSQGSSGTIYALVMPESEAAVQRVVDGSDTLSLASGMNGPDLSDAVRRMLRDRDSEWLSLFREPWTQKQDGLHIEYFDLWTRWASPIVRFDSDRFPFRYPTAGASQGIEKLLGEYATRAFNDGTKPVLHVFEGEYEGFAAYARGLNCSVHVHERSDWASTIMTCEPGFFFVSQPSAIDGIVWNDFDAFCSMIDENRMGQIEVVPDLTYVGSTAREWTVSMDHHCIRAFVISHSKPFGLYYHRVGGVFAREERPTLYGNVWFKNLTSLRIGIDMMRRHDVFELPRRYRDAQKEAVLLIARRLGLDGLRPADILVMAQAPIQAPGHPLSILERGCEDERVVRICLTPQMTAQIDPALAPSTSSVLARLRDDEETRLLELRSPPTAGREGDRRLFESRCLASVADGEDVRIVLHEADMARNVEVMCASTCHVLDEDIAEAAKEIVLQADDGTIRLLKGFNL